MLDRLLEYGGPPEHAVGAGSHGLGSEHREGSVNLAALLVVFALADQLQVDRGVAAFGPAFALGEQGPASGEHDDELGAVFSQEQRRQCAGGGREGRLVIEVERFEQAVAILLE